METYFAPAQRTERRKFKNQVEAVSTSPIMDTLLQAVDGVLIILNEDRQTVAVNHTLLDTLGITDTESILGLRPGQVLACVHGDEAPNGCGTTPDCVTCGAAICMMSALETDKTQEQICVLTKKDPGGVKDDCYLVRAQPIRVENRRWLLFIARDISRQQFWLNMERVFFHDISNLLTAMSGNSELLAMDHPGDLQIQQNKKLMDRLCNEVSLQKGLLNVEDKVYHLKKAKVTIKDIRTDLSSMITGHRASSGKHISEEWPDDALFVFADIHLVLKVLGNMVINALEATPGKGGIKIAVKEGKDGLLFEVWNPAVIPQKYHNRIFQRFFSTKARGGRGLGTYSMKLYGEKFLKGRVDFSSEKDKGTSFFFSLPR